VLRKGAEVQLPPATFSLSPPALLHPHARILPASCQGRMIWTIHCDHLGP